MCMFFVMYILYYFLWTILQVVYDSNAFTLAVP